VRVLLFLFCFVLVVGSIFVVKMIESFLSKEKSEIHTPPIPQSVDFLSAKNQTKEERVDKEAMLKLIAASMGGVSNETFTNKTAAIVVANATSDSQLKKKTYVRPLSIEAKPSFGKETIEKKPLQEDTPQIDNEEKTVEKRKDFSFFQGEKKLENLLLKAEEETAKGNYQLAKYFYEKYLEEKKDPKVYNNYGGVFFLLGDYEGAEKAFVAALSLEQNPVFKLNLILTKIKRNQTKEACQMFKKFQKELETLGEVAYIIDFIIDVCFFKGV
jgi:tetratricopeptide (TPR) repeat protein